jgi:hypothetical protein
MTGPTQTDARGWGGFLPDLLVLVPCHPFDRTSGCRRTAPPLVSKGLDGFGRV